ncbi:hypothetical protein F2P81_021021 [Scophthalmus maximus]|uniref:Uncharacterized protein n=1 Tax=Scophthalmus maximus TaxID=52904 RepID=A0A6A4S6T5_SCOMX|nr:hypothetical protein F2P81_021021 [Scophthalmus maximus]
MAHEPRKFDSVANGQRRSKSLSSSVHFRLTAGNRCLCHAVNLKVTSPLSLQEHFESTRHQPAALLNEYTVELNVINTTKLQSLYKMSISVLERLANRLPP